MKPAPADAAPTTRLYAYLVETRPRVSRVRHWKCARFASTCAALGFVLALVASAGPLWSVTQISVASSSSSSSSSSNGGEEPPKTLIVADGLWRRNVCFVPTASASGGGGGRDLDAFPDSLLSSLGLSCDEKPQLASCGPPDPAATLNDVEEQARREHCDRFTLAQSMQTFGVVSAFVAMLTFRFAAKRVGEMHPRPLAFVRAFATWTTVLAVYALGYVAALMTTSYMFAGERAVEWECETTNASTDVCRGPGPSFVLQHFASLCLTISSVVGLVLACARPTSDDEQAVVIAGGANGDVDEEVVAVTRVPLLSSSSANSSSSTNSAGPAVVVVAEEVRA